MKDAECRRLDDFPASNVFDPVASPQGRNSSNRGSEVELVVAAAWEFDPELRMKQLRQAMIGKDIVLVGAGVLRLDRRAGGWTGTRSSGERSSSVESSFSYQRRNPNATKSVVTP